MAQLSITEAIKQSPVGKTYFYKKYIGTGKITVSVDNSGKKYIDSSELLRVFGELKGGQTVNVHEQTTVDNTVQPEYVDSEQRELVRMLREQISDLKADKEFYQSQISSLTNRLESPTSQPNPFVRWWRGLK